MPTSSPAFGGVSALALCRPDRAQGDCAVPASVSLGIRDGEQLSGAPLPGVVIALSILCADASVRVLFPFLKTGWFVFLLLSHSLLFETLFPLLLRHHILQFPPHLSGCTFSIFSTLCPSRKSFLLYSSFYSISFTVLASVMAVLFSTQSLLS